MNTKTLTLRVAVTLLALSTCVIAEAPAGVEAGMAVKPSKTLNYLKKGSIDFVALLPSPPAVGSLEEQSEMREIKAWQTLRTEADKARCQDEETLVVFKAFREIVTSNFNSTSCPKTAKLFDALTVDSKHFSAAAKNHWGRRRPPYIDTTLVPAAKLEDEPAYPSGHATRGELFAEILSELMPQKRDALMARGQEIGFDRVIAAVHYPSDVAAGRMLGHVIARALLAEPKFQADLQLVKVELEAVAMK